MKSWRLVQEICVVAWALTMAACSEHELSTAPGPKTVPSQLSLTMAALPPFSGFLGVPGGQTLTLPSYTAFPEGIKVTFTAQGTIAVTSDSHANYFHDNVNAGPGGVWINGVYQQCSVGVLITYGAVGFGPPPCNPYDAATSWSVTTVVQGSGTAKRTPDIPVYHPGDCDTIVCHTYAGGQTITVVPLAGDLDLQAFYALEGRSARKALFIHPFTNTDQYAHQTVTFTDSTTPRGLPLKSLFHTWTMADPSAPNGYWNHTQPPACVGTNPSPVCAVDIRESGTYASHVRVNGVEHDDSITLYCSESEPLLNNDLVRQQMLAALDSSNAWASNQLVRKERQFFIVKDTVTPAATPYLMILPPAPGADLCGGTPIMPTPSVVPPDTKILSWGHDHPFEASDTTMGQNLGSCRDKAGRLMIGVPMLEGASPEDRDATDKYNDPTVNRAAQAAGWLPMSSFIIDYHNVYVLRPGQKLGDELTAGNKFNWDGFYQTLNDTGRLSRRCGWPKRVVQ